MRSLRFAQTPKDPATVINLFQSETSEILEIQEPASVRYTIYLLLAFVISFIIAATFTRLDRVVQSVSGELVTTTPIEVVQSLDPALIKTINVKAGDRVKAGDLLATLDPTFAAADVESLNLQVANYEAQIARCEAELSGRTYTPAPVADPTAARYGVLQKALFLQRKAQYDEQMKAYAAQIGQYKATLTKLRNNEFRYAERMNLAKEVETMRTQLYQMQVGSRLNALSAIDTKAELLRTLESEHNSIEETQKQIEATAATRDSYTQKWLGDTTQELVTARNQYNTAAQQLAKASRKKDLVRLTATQDAVVLKISKLSPGSVAREADVIMELAPLNSPLEAEIRIAPKDIGFIRTGDPAKIKLDAFDFIEHGVVQGTVNWISEGALMIDERTNQPTQVPYYKARINLTDTALRNVPNEFRLIPGMTAVADVHIGTRSILQYLISGAARTVQEGMREAH